MVVVFDDVEKAAKLSLRQTEILAKLDAIVDDISSGCPCTYVLSMIVKLCPFYKRRSVSVPKFHPEYGRYMLESTPGTPYTGSISDLLSVESNMRYRYKSQLGHSFSKLTPGCRRSLARKHLNPNEVPLTFTSFPRLGVSGQFTEPYYDPNNAVSSHSLFLPEQITNPHIRFP